MQFISSSKHCFRESHFLLHFAQVNSNQVFLVMCCFALENKTLYYTLRVDNNNTKIGSLVTKYKKYNFESTCYQRWPWVLQKTPNYEFLVVVYVAVRELQSYRILKGKR